MRFICTIYVSHSIYIDLFIAYIYELCILGKSFELNTQRSNNKTHDVWQVIT